MSYDDYDDETLLAELREAALGDDVVAVAKASLSLRLLDVEVATLVADSGAEATSAVRARDSGPRLLTFEGPGLSVEVEVEATGATRGIVGQLVPPQAASVEARWPDGSTPCEADEVGHFIVRDVPAGPVSFVCRTGDSATPVATSWVTI